jgi:hypothetical protein
MASALPRNFVRRGGSGFTLFTFGGQPISFCQQVAHTSPRPVGQGASAIQPMDEPYPIEIITPAAAGMGQIVLNLFELFGSGGKASKAWDRLGVGVNKLGANPFGAVGQSDTSQFLNLGGTGIFSGAVDIVDIFIRQAQADPSSMSVVQIIRPPANPNGAQQPYYIQYVGCVITDVQDGEQIDVGTLEVIKQITVAYRYPLRDGQASAAFAQRDALLGAGGTIGL